jgi:hypothetical protein
MSVLIINCITLFGLLALGASTRVRAHAEDSPDRASLGLEIKPRGFILENVAKGEKRDLTFSITNLSKDKLAILGVKGDCSCTVVDASIKVIDVNSSSHVKVHIDGSVRLGTVKRSIEIRTDRGTITVPITLTVVDNPNWLLSKTSIHLPDSAIDTIVTSDFTISWANIAVKPTAIVGVATDVSWLTAKVERVSESTYKTFLVKARTAPAGFSKAQISIETSDPNSRFIRVPVFLVVNSEFYMSPNPVVMPSTKVGELATMVIRMGGWNGSEIPILTVDNGQVRRTTVSNERFALYEIRLKPSAAGIRTTRAEVKQGATVIKTFPVLIRGE